MALKEVFRENFENQVGDLDAATPTWQIRTSIKDKQDFAPFNIMWVFNDSDEKLQVKFDGSSDNYVIVNAKGVLGLSLEDGITFTYIDIVNLSATDPAANEVRVRIAKIEDKEGGI